MMNQKLVKFMVTLFVAGIFLSSATPALATSPEKLTIPVAGSYILAQCDGFNVMDEYTGLLTITEFYNLDGELERLTYQENSQDRIYNSETGFSVSNKYTVNQTYYVDTSELYIRGVAYNVTVPGYGSLVFDSGLGVYYIVDGEYIGIKFAGNYQADITALCEAMDQ